MYYRSGTAGRCCICAVQTLREHSTDRGTLTKTNFLVYYNHTCCLQYSLFVDHWQYAMS